MCPKPLPLVAFGMLAVALLTPAGAAAQINQIRNALQDIDAKLDAVVVPFKVLDTAGGLCDSAGEGTSNPEIVIDSDGAVGSFVVTSVFAQLGGTGCAGDPISGLQHQQRDD